MTNSRQTAELLYCIASHLSSRSECKGQNYTLTISDIGTISFEPNVQVFPSRYNRKQSDRTSVLEHVLTAHFPEIYLGRDDLGSIQIDPLSVLDGTYEYQSSFDNKRRRWVRIQ